MNAVMRPPTSNKGLFLLCLSGAAIVLGIISWTDKPKHMYVSKSNTDVTIFFHGQPIMESVYKESVVSGSFGMTTESTRYENLTETNSYIPPNLYLEEWLGRIMVTKKKPNVLFLIADDMRPDIKAYAHEASPWIYPDMFTPNLDRLASKSLLFRRAYCQQSWCNPSRSSFLTSRRPDTTMVHNNSVFFRQINPDFKTLPQYFKEHGYVTFGVGKVFHLMGLPGDHDDEFSWSLPMFRSGEFLDEGAKACKPIKAEERGGKLLLDEIVTNYAMETLNKLAPLAKTVNHPFFLAVGIKKPHLNFAYPAEFDRFYPDENISMPSNPLTPENMPNVAWSTSNEIRIRPEYRNASENWSPDKPLADWAVRELRKSYWATISFVDDLIGQILQRLNELRLADDTIVAFIGDHGFHLGEHSIIGKNTNFEVANNSPMMIRVPGVTDKGSVTDKLVEFVDIFPTLVDLAGLPSVPLCPKRVAQSSKVSVCTEGSSLVPLFENPDIPKWKDRVFYQYPHWVSSNNTWCMGYSLRTENHRYTEWVEYNYTLPTDPANWNKICGVELYDVKKDPDETVNIAYQSNKGKLRNELSSKLRAGWHEALPS